MEQVLVSFILAACPLPKEVGTTSECQEYYINCVIKGSGQIEVTDMLRCKDERDSATPTQQPGE